jgi:hypothetical protein
MQPSKFQQVIDILTQKGWTSEQITQLATELTQASFNKLCAEAVLNFTKEDLTAIENCATDEDANNKIKELYKERTGKDANEEAEKFLDIFAQGFLDEHLKENPN